MIDTDKYTGHTPQKKEYDGYDRTWSAYGSRATMGESFADAKLIADAPLLLEFIQKIVKEWNMPNKCNQEFGKDVRQLMYEYGLITFNEETRRYEVIE